MEEFKSQQISTWSCIIANQRALTPISYEGEMRHTVPLFCYKSCFVDGWQLFIRSNLFKPPLRALTFSTLTHLQFTNRTADLLREGLSWHSSLFSLSTPVMCGWVEVGGEKKKHQKVLIQSYGFTFLIFKFEFFYFEVKKWTYF